MIRWEGIWINDEEIKGVEVLVIMYRERGGVGSKAEVTSVDRKRINDVLDKQLERSSPSTSRTINGKERSSSSLLTAKDHRDSRSASASASIPKNSRASDGLISIWSLYHFQLYKSEYISCIFLQLVLSNILFLFFNYVIICLWDINLL